MSADSLSSPPPLTRYFDLLPLELIRHIIEQLAPSEYNQRMYGERKKSLYSTCLVSRLFQKLAQPLLFEIIEINKDEEMDIFNSLVYKDVGKRLLSITRILVPWDVDDVFGRSHGSDWTAALVRLEHLQVLDGTLTTINMSRESAFLFVLYLEAAERRSFRPQLPPPQPRQSPMRLRAQTTSPKVPQSCMYQYEHCTTFRIRPPVTPPFCFLRQSPSLYRR